MTHRLIFLLLLLAALNCVGCSGSDSNSQNELGDLTTRVDSTNDQTFQRSLIKLQQGLTDKGREKFTKALTKIAVKDGEEHPSMNEASNNADELAAGRRLHKILNGKTAGEIIAMGE